jgi:DNA-directed RNA polymerase specialized sigma24 family protein
VEPRLEAGWVTQRSELGPGRDHRGLDGVLRQVEVAEDPDRDRKASVAHQARQGNRTLPRRPASPGGPAPRAPALPEARRRARWSEGLRIFPGAGAHGPDDYLTVDDRDQLERAFQRLTLQQRAVLVYHHYLGLSISEVAARTGLPVGTAKSRLRHATRALRASIEADARSRPDSQEQLA